MSDRTGVGVVELAILSCLADFRAGSGEPYRKSADVLAAVEGRIGLAPRYAYEVLCDLARPWTVPLRLVDCHGDYGMRGNNLGPAAPRYTEVGLSRLGELVLDAEAGTIAPVPIGLINGDAHAEGARPPFSPRRVIEAIRRVLEEPTTSDTAIVELVGPPEFLTGCSVSGNLGALAAGEAVELRLEAEVTLDVDQHRIVIEHIPPTIGPHDLVQDIANRAIRPPWADRHPELDRTARLAVKALDDLSTDDHDRIVCTAEAGGGLEELRDQLLSVYGVWTTMSARLPAPLPDLVRRFVHDHAEEDLASSLSALELAIEART